MDRREFAQGAAALAALTLAGVPLMVLAQKKAEPGTDYRALDKPVPTDAPAGKIEVVEFFWYSCPHCNAFEPQLEAWAKSLPSDVSLKRVPIAFRDDFVPQQRLFYTLEAMGKLDEMHRRVFQAIHVDKQPTNKQDTILAWAEKQGLDKAKFNELYNSFTVSSKARRAVQLQDAFKVEGVPALGIAGRYYTDGSMAGNMGRALLVTDQLIADARKNR